jgi:tripartite-type tricarboxylate transporter receptor subunit TctC
MCWPRRPQGKSWEDLIAQAKAQPGTIRFATSGVGSVGHIMLEQIQHQTGAQFVHVPYKGVGQTVNDAVGGHFEIMTGNPYGTINGLITQGKLRVLATTGPQRAAASPRYPRWQKKAWRRPTSPRCSALRRRRAPPATWCSA